MEADQATPASSASKGYNSLPQEVVPTERTGAHLIAHPLEMLCIVELGGYGDRSTLPSLPNQDSGGETFDVVILVYLTD